MTVTSAFGSDRGGQVIPPFFTDYDVLKFEGERAREVRDVSVGSSELEQVDYPEHAEDGRRRALRRRARPSTESTSRSTRSSCTNPNDDAVAVEVALMSWDEPPEADPQQFEWAIPLEDV